MARKVSFVSGSKYVTRKVNADTLAIHNETMGATFVAIGARGDYGVFTSHPVTLATGERIGTASSQRDAIRVAHAFLA